LLRFLLFNFGLLTRNQLAPGRSCDRPTHSRLSVVFLDRTGNAELVPKFHVALFISYTALPKLTSNFHPNVALRMLDHIALLCSPSRTRVHVKERKNHKHKEHINFTSYFSCLHDLGNSMRVPPLKSHLHCCLRNLVSAYLIADGLLSAPILCTRSTYRSAL
jgi:hypothetical protein